MTRRRTYEAPDMGAFVGRTLRAMVKRAAEGDQEVLSVLRDLAPVLDQALVDSARTLHDDRGYSWAFIGNELGMTRQAAQQRFAPKAPKATPAAPADQVTIDDLIVDPTLSTTEVRFALLRGDA